MNEIIKFGTDGWRAIIAESFTFKNVARLVEGFQSYLFENFEAPECVIGYDTRFLSKEFATLAAYILAQGGVKVSLSVSHITTPMVSYVIYKNKLSSGLMISASHNPSAYNGIKIKSQYATSVGKDITSSIESKIPNEPKYCENVSWEQVASHANIHITDFENDYVEYIKNYMDLELLKQSDLSVVCDSMFGAGKDIFSRIFEGTGVNVFSLHTEINPSFGGVNPEPIENNLGELQSFMQEGSYAIGLAIDGDGDRIGAVANDGTYIECGKLFTLLLLYLIEDKQKQGVVVKTISSTSCIDKIAKKYEKTLHETSIGFKNIANIMLQEQVLMGAEESGGMGFGDTMPERDGILAAVLLVQMLAQRKKTIGQLLKEIDAEYGAHYYLRVDVQTSVDKEFFYEMLKKEPFTHLGESKMVEIKSFDGTKFIAEDGSWLLFRFSGTEPMLRIYTEASSEEKVKELLKFGKDYVDSFVTLNA